MTLTIGLAFLAGLVSFFSPCVLTVVPLYVSYLSGRTLADASSDGQNKQLRSGFWHGVFFVLGFSLVFLTLGLAFTALGRALNSILPLLSRFGGVVLIVFGLHVTGLLRIRFLDADLRPQNTAQQQRGFLTSFLMGVFFSAGWSPCVGPTLSMILVLAMDSSALPRGMLLLAVYSLGLAVPFLAASLGIGWVSYLLQRHKKALHVVQVIMGVLMLLIGVMLLFGIFNKLISFTSGVSFGL